MFILKQEYVIIIELTLRYRVLSIVFIFILCASSCSAIAPPQKNTPLYDKVEQLDAGASGQILFAPMYSRTTYLIDKNGQINNTWSSEYFPGESVYMLDNGTILRSIKITLTGGGSGGGVQKIAWDNTLLWDFRFYSDTYLSTHDIEPLPNGNVLILAWETKTRAEAIDAGRNPNNIQNYFKVNFVVEVKPTGPTSGEVVWEWHAWDHLIQDYDSSKVNYGVVENHPELIDINFGFDSSGTDPSDWLHCNSVDYNPELDQIMISVRHFSEIWVIDHSTTTQQAAGHTGGNSGKGGDLLYRWGNPAAYRRGTIADRKFFEQHDATWIAEGYPGEGNILVFNNGVGRPGGSYTSIDEITPPIQSSTGQYYCEDGAAFGPEEQSWVYPANFFASFIGGAQRIKNGNTIICNGPAGTFLEVTPGNVIIWEYTNPYPYLFLNQVFKIDYLLQTDPSSETPDLYCEGVLDWRNVISNNTVYGSFSVQNIGGVDSLLNWQIESYPSWGIWSFEPESGENLHPHDGKVTVHVSVRAPDIKNAHFQGTIKIVNQDNPNDFDAISISLITLTNTRFAYPFITFFKNHLRSFQILSRLYERGFLQK